MNDRHYSDGELDDRILTEEENGVVWADAHLLRCSECSDRYRFLKRFYDQFRLELGKKPHPRTAELAGSLQPDHRLVLTPFRGHMRPAAGSPDNGLLLHAAQTVAEAENRYTSVATFALASTGVLARVVCDQQTGLYRISVLSENPDHRRFVLVGVGGPQGQTPLTATDSEGIATIRMESGLDWNAMYVVVITPSVTLHLSGGLPVSGSLSCGTVSVGIHSITAGVQVTLLNPSIERIGHALAVLGDGSASLREVTDNTVVFEHAVARQAIALRFFL